MFKQDSRIAELPPPLFPSSLVAQVCLTLFRKHGRTEEQQKQRAAVKTDSHQTVSSFSVFKYSLTREEFIVIYFYK